MFWQTARHGRQGPGGRRGALPGDALPRRHAAPSHEQAGRRPGATCQPGATPSQESASQESASQESQGDTAAVPPPDEPEQSPPPLFADEVPADDGAADDTAVAATRVQATDTRVDEDRPDVETESERSADSTRREFGLPDIPAPAAAAVTGAVVGLLAVGLTWLGLQGCELATGTQSCGGVGLLMLLLILAAMVMLGKVMLAAWGIDESMSISFLAVGLIAVICLLFLINVLLSTWMLVVIPLVGAASYALSHWVTEKFTSVELD